jgi:tetratricopeptide (TPR) repeat protein
MSRITPTKQLAVVDLLADGVRYERGGVVQRARECFEAVARQENEHPAEAAEGWWRLANLHRLHSSWDEAIFAAHRAAELARANGLADTEANALNIKGAVYWAKGEYERAEELFTRMLALSRTDATRAKALQNLGGIAAEQGAFAEGERLFVESRASYRAAGDQRGEAVSLLNIGQLQMDRGDLDMARETLETAVAGAKVSGDLEMLAAAQLNLGIALGALGRTGDAEERITTAYGQFTIASIPAQRVRCLVQLAALASARGEKTGARVCLAHARTVAESSGLPREMRVIDEHLDALKVKGSANG